MDLYLLRHAKAEVVSLSGRDEERELTPEAVQRLDEKLPVLNPVLKGLEIVLISPFRRTRQTTCLVVESLARPEIVQVCDFLAAGSMVEDVVSELSEYRRQSILVVGHNPWISELVTFFDEDQRGDFHLKTSQMAHLHFDDELGSGLGRLVKVY